ncbi:MAG: nuclear transport factor 2 family protein [Actinomycetota bacterium]|nr:nuclear transport factor 2 family protein [Actinomycetota bacterium]
MRAEDVRSWVEGYVRAWNTNDPDDIAALFSEDARYFTEPHADPWRGRAGIVEGWLEAKDEPGETTFDYDVVAIDGDLAFVKGVTTYRTPPRRYSNLWEVRLDANGRCTEFVEWWMEQ